VQLKLRIADLVVGAKGVVVKHLRKEHTEKRKPRARRLDPLEGKGPWKEA